MNTKTIAYNLNTPVKNVVHAAIDLGLKMEYDRKNRCWRILENADILADTLAQ